MGALDAIVQSKILQLARQPFTARQHAVWTERVQVAYRELSQHPAFHTVLEHWVVTVLMNPDADPGARGLVIEIVQSMHDVNQSERGMHYGEHEGGAG